MHPTDSKIQSCPPPPPPPSLKFVSISRLELTAAALSVKISKMLKKELDIHVDDEIFWTDSKVVLGYINSDAPRFKVFVANRVQQIKVPSNGIMLE